MSNLPKFNIIVAVDRWLGIGEGNTIPWKIKEDIKYFKYITCGLYDDKKSNAVIMGRKTWESIPDKYRPLQSRFNIVLTKQKEYIASGACVCDTLGKALAHAKEAYTENIFVIGGGQLYSEAIKSDLLDKIYITKIDATWACDTFFPDIPDNFKSISRSNIITENGTDFYFEVLKNAQSK